jgi:histidinol phosphatase-like PHP family hydrolase
VRLFEKIDFHVHTCQSPCARPEMTVADIAERARRVGCEQIGLADHIFQPGDVGRITANSHSVLAQVERSPRFYVGCEVCLVRPGVLAADIGLLREAEFVLVAPNHFHLGTVAAPPDLTPRGLASYWLDLIASISEMRGVHAIAHPYRLGTYNAALGGRSIMELCPADRFESCIRRLAQRQIALELRSPEDATVGFDQHVDFYRRCAQLGVKLLVGSDAHWLASIGTTQRLAPLIQAADISDAQLWLPPGTPHPSRDYLCR